jgi:hypothetical protein
MDAPAPTYNTELISEWQAMESNPHLLQEDHFCHRAEAIEFLEFHLLENNALPSPLQDKAWMLHHKLCQVDHQLFQKLRAQLRASKDIKSLVDAYIDVTNLEGGTDYDNLDQFINRLLAPTDDSLEPQACHGPGAAFKALEPSEVRPPQPQLALEPDMVYYQKTPARVLFYLAGRLHPDPCPQHAQAATQRFVDIGAGLGQVVILFHLLTGIPSHGIDIEPAFIGYAQTCAQELALSQVTFLKADALSADFSQGSIFFLYTPFSGKMLQEVLDRLQKVAALRPITLISYGPITETIQSLPWVRPVADLTNAPESLGVFRTAVHVQPV